MEKKTILCYESEEFRKLISEKVSEMVRTRTSDNKCLQEVLSFAQDDESLWTETRVAVVFYACMFDYPDDVVAVLIYRTSGTKILVAI